MRIARMPAAVIALAVALAAALLALATRSGAEHARARAAARSDGPTDPGAPPSLAPRANDGSRGVATRGVGPHAGSAAHGIGMDAPGSLTTIPAHYQLAPIGGHRVAVRLAGGSPTIYAPVVFAAPPSRAVRGRVVASDGGPVAGAIVIADKPLIEISTGHVDGAAGAMTDASGAFAIDAPSDGAVVLAFDPSGWSEVAAVADAPLELHLRGRGALSGRITYDGHGESFELYLALLPDKLLRISYETDPDGRFTIASLPPGSYQLRAGLAQPAAGGSSRLTDQTIAITAGQTTDVELAQTSATLVVLSAQLPEDAKASTPSLQYWLFDGAAPPDLATAYARAAQEHARYALYAGKDRDTPFEIQDVSPGSYAACAAIPRGAFAGAFDCTPVVVVDGDSVREVAIELAR